MSNMKAPLPQCAAMVRVQNILSGKWKITILWYIAEYEVQRFGELRRRLGDITQSTLTKQLRELEQDGFISRYIYQEVPPKVEYSLTGLGKSFIPILKDIGRPLCHSDPPMPLTVSPGISCFTSKYPPPP